MGAIQNIVPKAHTLSSSEMVEVEENGEVIERPDRPYELRAQRWSGVKQNENKKLSKVIDIEKNFNFRL